MNEILTQIHRFLFLFSVILHSYRYLIGSPNEIPLFGPPILEKAVQSFPRVQVSEVFSYDIYLTTELSETIKMTESVLKQIFILLSSGVARQNKQVQQILTTLWNKRCLHGFLLLILKNYWMRCWLLYCLLKEVEYQMYITTCTCMSSLSSVSFTYRWKQWFAGFAIFPEYVLIPSIFFLHLWRKHKKGT